MNIEIVSVGTELLMGEIVNTNAQELMKFCKKMGFNVFYESTVGDNPERLKKSLQLAFTRGADTIITTGGLGPTNDDLTKQISAEVLGLEMVYLPTEAKKVEEKVSFLTGEKQISKSNYQQAYFAKGAYILENDVGTANGCVIEKDGKRIVNLPGPPREMKYVLNHALRPYFGKYQEATLYTKEFVIYQTGESQLADELAGLFTLQEEVTIALYAGEGYVRIRLATKTDSRTKAYANLDKYEHMLRNILKERLMPIDSLDTEWLQQLPAFALQLENCDFLIPFFSQETLKNKIRNEENNYLQVACKKKGVGEIVYLEASFNGHHYQMKIPSLKAAIYSVSKNEQRILVFLKSIYEKEDTYEK